MCNVSIKVSMKIFWNICNIEIWNILKHMQQLLIKMRVKPRHRFLLWGQDKMKPRREFTPTTEWRYQNFERNRYRDFFYDTKFSETETETFFRDQIFPKPKPRLFPETKFFETETLKNLAKVSRPRPKPRLLNIFWNEIRKIWTYKQNWNVWDQNLEL